MENLGIRSLLQSAIFAALIFCCSSSQSYAVVVAGGDGTQNTTAPVDDFGFSNVAKVYDSQDGFFTTGVYLGNGWVLSAYHEVRDSSGGFQFGSVVLGNTSYAVDSSSALRLTNSDNTSADLALFRLTIVPAGISSVTISSTAPVANAPLVLMGNGLNRAAEQTNWNVNTTTNPWTWSETTATGNASGYKAGSGQALRWGTNNLAGSLVADDGFGKTSMFYTNFSNTPGEAQGAGGDSGGGVFYKNGASWELSGILLATGTYSGQPTGSSVFGDETYAADLSQYRGQILAAIPESSVSWMVLASGGIFAARSFFRARRRRTESGFAG